MVCFAIRASLLFSTHKPLPMFHIMRLQFPCLIHCTQAVLTQSAGMTRRDVGAPYLASGCHFHVASQNQDHRNRQELVKIARLSDCCAGPRCLSGVDDEKHQSLQCAAYVY